MRQGLPETYTFVAGDVATYTSTSTSAVQRMFSRHVQSVTQRYKIPTEISQNSCDLRHVESSEPVSIVLVEAHHGTAELMFERLEQGSFAVTVKLHVFVGYAGSSRKWA